MMKCKTCNGRGKVQGGLAGETLEDCPDCIRCDCCDGNGVVDSGGFTPWGQPIDLPCPRCNSKWDTLAAIGASWKKDSSLEKWFPFTAQELTSLRERVKELEAESKHLKCELDDRNATLSFVRKKFETTNECYTELLRKFSECNQRLEALESQHNRKGPKFGDGLKAESAYNPMAVYGPVKMPPEFQHFPSGNTLPPKCAQCGRVL